MQKADQVLSYSGAPRCPPATARAIGAGLSASTPPPQPHCCARAGYPLQSLARVAVLSVVAATSLAQSITPVPFAQTRLTDRFWAPRLATHASTTLPICIDQTEVKTGRIRNFEKAAAGLGQHEVSWNPKEQTIVEKLTNIQTTKKPTRKMAHLVFPDTRAKAQKTKRAIFLPTL